MHGAAVHTFAATDTNAAGSVRLALRRGEADQTVGAFHHGSIQGGKPDSHHRTSDQQQIHLLAQAAAAQAILAVQKANADAIRLLNEAMPNDKVLALRSLEALAKVANGKATKIIIPSELQNLGGVVPAIKELVTEPRKEE